MPNSLLVCLTVLSAFVLYGCRTEVVKARNRLEGKYAIVWQDSTNYPPPYCCNTRYDTVTFTKSKKDKNAVIYEEGQMNYFRNDTFISSFDPCYGSTILHIIDENNIDLYYQFIPPHSTGVVVSWSKGKGHRID